MVPLVGHGSPKDSHGPPGTRGYLGRTWDWMANLDMSGRSGRMPPEYFQTLRWLVVGFRGEFVLKWSNELFVEGKGTPHPSH